MANDQMQIENEDKTTTDETKGGRTKEEKKGTHFLTRPALRQRYLQLKEELGLKDEEMFESMISTLALNNAIEVLPDQKAQIAEFQRHTQALTDLYQVSLEYGFNTGERVRNELRTEMDEKDEINAKLQSQIQELKNKLNEAKTEIADKQEVLKRVEDTNAKQSKMIAALEKQVADGEEISEIKKLLAEVQKTLGNAK